MLETGIYPAWDAAACNIHSGNTLSAGKGEGTIPTAGLQDLSVTTTAFDPNGESVDVYSFLALLKHSPWPRAASESNFLRENYTAGLQVSSVYA